MSIRQKEILGLFFIVFSVLSIISLFGHDISESPNGLPDNYKPNNYLGYFGIWISHYYYTFLGYTSIVFPIITSFIGYCLFANKDLKENLLIFIYILLVGIFFSVFTSYLANIMDIEILSNYFSGFIGFSLFTFVNHFLGLIGTSLLMFLCLILFFTYMFNVSIFELFNKVYLFLVTCFKKTYNLIKISCKFLFSLVKKEKADDSFEINIDKEGVGSVNDDSFKEQTETQDKNIIDSIPADGNLKEFVNDINEEDIVLSKNEENSDGAIREDVSISNEEDSDDIVIEEENEIIEGNLEDSIKKKSKYFQYKLPQLSYLEDPIEIVKQNEDELREKGQQLKYALNTFGVDGEIVKVSPGPIISLFEVEPAVGVRVNKFINLSDDLARVMKAQRVRIIAPIPGSKSVGIELPNDQLSIVYLKSILNSKKFIESKSKLTVALGKTTSGDAYVFDLCKMPHLLVAGATGAGKSVCINTIILSILYKSKPDEVKFILLDPKKLELSTYQSLVGYHLITSKNLDEYVMTTPENSVAILNSAIIEMERRFTVFSEARVRNIAEYHVKQEKDSSLEKIPYIVVLIDELADLMMTSGRAVEEPITRLAQKARAVGIHLVVATQRPSVDVITGLIKSNFPSRISFLVSSKIDSRTILDQMGAEKLLGRGDMLFLLPGSASPIRLHNAFVTLDEIEKIMEHISSQPKPDEIKLPEFEIKKNDSDVNLDGNEDELLKDAAKLVVDYQQASVSLLQRKFRIGYSRAGRLVDELESLGIISAYNGSKARDVLVDQSYLKEIFSEE